MSAATAVAHRLGRGGMRRSAAGGVVWRCWRSLTRCRAWRSAAVVGGLCGLALTLVFRRYLGILGADRRKPAERQRAPRSGTASPKGTGRLGFMPRGIGFLDWIDGFFCRCRHGGSNAVPTAFGLRKPAPLWTAPAFDRCLLLALIYPLLVEPA